MNKKIARRIVESFKGELFSIGEYKNTYEYVIDGGWEKDYFSSWLEGCSDYPYLGEIKDFCIETDRIIRLYIDAVEEEDSAADCDFDVKDDNGEIIGAVYYDDSVGYCFVCDDDGHEEYGFSRPDKAECALLDYYYSN